MCPLDAYDEAWDKRLVAFLRPVRARRVSTISSIVKTQNSASSIELALGLFCSSRAIERSSESVRVFIDRG